MFVIFSPVVISPADLVAAFLLSLQTVPWAQGCLSSVRRLFCPVLTFQRLKHRACGAGPLGRQLPFKGARLCYWLPNTGIFQLPGELPAPMQLSLLGTLTPSTASLGAFMFLIHRAASRHGDLGHPAFYKQAKQGSETRGGVSVAMQPGPGPEFFRASVLLMKQPTNWTDATHPPLSIRG